jgi:hypothetical protein
MTCFNCLSHRLTPEVLEQRGVSLQQALATLRQCLPTDAVLVGQGIGQDVQWLQLHEGRDFQVGLPWNEHRLSCMPHRVFGNVFLKTRHS